jgi:tRNA (cytosine49-C5)-methyltransferase
MNKKFLEYHKGLMENEFELFLEWIKKPPRKSIRLNPIRRVEEFRDELDSMQTEPIPWCEGGYWVEGQGLGATIPHQLGYYYLQEAASMLPPVILNPGKGDIVLDIAAAPGSKSTQMAPMCNTLVANEPDYTRRKALVANIERCGIMNAIITGFDGTRFPRVSFDKVLVDAPCSNVGSVRKSPNVANTWSPGFVRSISGLQKGLAKAAFERLEEGGEMVYSTCTTTLEENEEVVLWLLDKYPDAKLEKASAKIKSRPGLLPGTEKCMRVYPWDNDAEFFFIARISKND